MSRCVRIPRERESMHVLVMGDTGQGKSAIVRQALCQIEERGETAIVYDPAMEYLPQFYEPERGDIILNPLDARCPFWTPGDEVPHEAERLRWRRACSRSRAGRTAFSWKRRGKSSPIC